MNNQRLYRSTINRVLAGVAGGIAEHLGTDPVIIRILFVVTVLAGGGGALIYLILWVAIPERPITSQMFSETPPQDSAEPSKPFNATDESFPRPAKPYNNNSLMFGILLIAFGALMMTANFLPRISFSHIWPAAIIIAGVVLIFTALGKSGHNQ